MDQETATVTVEAPEETPAETPATPAAKRRTRAQAADPKSPVEPKPEPPPEPILRVARGLSWVRFVYPFSFDSKDFDQHVKLINDGVLDETSDSDTNGLDHGWSLMGWRSSSKGESEDG